MNFMRKYQEVELASAENRLELNEGSTFGYRLRGSERESERTNMASTGTFSSIGSDFNHRAGNNNYVPRHKNFP